MPEAWTLIGDGRKPAPGSHLGALSLNQEIASRIPVHGSFLSNLDLQFEIISKINLQTS
jgi:hypothetical protein